MEDSLHMHCINTIFGMEDFNIMKKKILFLCSNMGVGGVQKSLVSLLQCFDYDRYKVNLLLFDPAGVFMDQIPANVNILPPPIDPDYCGSGPTAVLKMIKKEKWKHALIRAVSCLFWLFDKSVGAVIMEKGIPALEESYDIAIDYGGQQILYYMVDKVKSKKKISYFHSDYKKWSYYEREDRKYYSKVDAIITVSDECVNSMKDIFPEYADKIFCIENINSERTVNLFPLKENPFSDSFDGVRLVTVGRVCVDKGIDFAVEALRSLIDNGYKVRWYFVGPITERKICEKFVKKYRVEQDIVFLGALNNPYAYMKYADIVVHPARFEGKAVAVEEAKLLHKPIVATCFTTVKDQIDNEETGLIVSMNGNDVFRGIQRLIDEPELREHIIERQRCVCMGNETEVRKLYHLIEE